MRRLTSVVSWPPSGRILNWQSKGLTHRMLLVRGFLAAYSSIFYFRASLKFWRVNFCATQWQQNETVLNIRSNKLKDNFFLSISGCRCWWKLCTIQSTLFTNPVFLFVVLSYYWLMVFPCISQKLPSAGRLCMFIRICLSCLLFQANAVGSFLTCAQTSVILSQSLVVNPCNLVWLSHSYLFASLSDHYISWRREEIGHVQFISNPLSPSTEVSNRSFCGSHVLVGTCPLML
jgi:hypothetical protein